MEAWAISKRPGSSRAALAAAAVIATIAVAVMVLHGRAFPNVFVDDAFISLRYAERLAHGKGLTWTGGEAVEGYSNLLWVLLMAGLGTIFDDLVVPGRVLGVVAASAAVLAAVYAAMPWRRPAESAAPMFAALLIPGSG